MTRSTRLFSRISSPCSAKMMTSYAKTLKGTKPRARASRRHHLNRSPISNPVGELPLEDVPEIGVERPRDLSHGDWGILPVAMRCAKQAHMNPREIAPDRRRAHRDRTRNRIGRGRRSRLHQHQAFRCRSAGHLSRGPERRHGLWLQPCRRWHQGRPRVHFRQSHRSHAPWTRSVGGARRRDGKRPLIRRL